MKAGYWQSSTIWKTSDHSLFNLQAGCCFWGFVLQHSRPPSAATYRKSYWNPWFQYKTTCTCKNSNIISGLIWNLKQIYQENFIKTEINKYDKGKNDDGFYLHIYRLRKSVHKYNHYHGCGQAVPCAYGWLRILVLSKKAYAGHPGFHSFRALGSL